MYNRLNGWLTEITNVYVEKPDELKQEIVTTIETMLYQYKHGKFNDQRKGGFINDDSRERISTIDISKILSGQLILVPSNFGKKAFTWGLASKICVGIWYASVIDAWNRKILSSRLYGTDATDTEALKMHIIRDFGDFSGLIAMYVIENE